MSGEVYECPDCGEKTEVYSRITGYYRPVQNWNDGKAQEYKERKLYDVEHSSLKASSILKKDVSIASEAEKKIEEAQKMLYHKNLSQLPHGRGSAERVADSV